MPIAEEAQRYYKSGKPFLHNYLPYWAANFVDRTLILLIPIFGVLIPAIKFAPIALHVSAQVAHRPLVRAACRGRSRNGAATGSARAPARYLARLDAIEAEIKAARLPNWLREQAYLLRAAIDLVRERLGTPEANGRRRARRDAPRRRARTLERPAGLA